MLNKAVEVLLSISDKDLGTVLVLGKCLQKLGRGEEVGANTLLIVSSSTASHL